MGAGPRDPIALLQGELRQRDQGGIASLVAIASVYHSRYLSDTEFLKLRYGLKYDQARLRTGKVRDVLNLVGAEYRRDMTNTRDIGLHGTMMHAARTGCMTSSFGVSVMALHLSTGVALAVSRCADVAAGSCQSCWGWRAILLRPSVYHFGNLHFRVVAQPRDSISGHWWRRGFNRNVWSARCAATRWRRPGCGHSPYNARLP